MGIFDEVLNSITPSNELSIIQNSLLIPAPLTESSSLKEAKRVDVQVTNDMLTSCYHGLSQATSITALSRMIDTTLKVIEVRRKVLCLEYGATTNGVGKTFNDPLED